MTYEERKKRARENYYLTHPNAERRAEKKYCKAKIIIPTPYVNPDLAHQEYYDTLRKEKDKVASSIQRKLRLKWKEYSKDPFILIVEAGNSSKSKGTTTYECELYVKEFKEGFSTKFKEMVKSIEI